MPEEYDAGEAWLKMLRGFPGSKPEPKKRFSLTDEEGMISVPTPYGTRKRVPLEEYLKEKDADWQVMLRKAKRLGFSEEQVNQMLEAEPQTKRGRYTREILLNELRTAEQNRLQSQMEPGLESGTQLPYLDQYAAKAQGYTPMQAANLNALVFGINMFAPTGEVAAAKMLKAPKRLQQVFKYSYGLPKKYLTRKKQTSLRSAMSGFSIEDRKIFEQSWKQYLREVPILKAQQRLQSMEVPNVPLKKGDAPQPFRDPNVVTKGDVEFGSASHAEIPGHPLPWLDAHAQPGTFPHGRFSPGYLTDVGDEADVLQQLRAALAKEGLPRDLVVEPTKGMYKDIGQKMYMMPRVKSDLTGPWPGEYRKLAHTDFSKMSKQDRISLVNQLDDAMYAWHRQGVGHGDLHSENILISYKKNKPTLEIIDPWPSKDPVWSIGKDLSYSTDHKMRILYPKIHGRSGLFLGKQSDMYMKKYGVDPIDVEDYKRLSKIKRKQEFDASVGQVGSIENPTERLRNARWIRRQRLGKQRIKDLAEGND